jgi:hypothetical protein
MKSTSLTAIRQKRAAGFGMTRYGFVFMGAEASPEESAFLWLRLTTEN